MAGKINSIIVKAGRESYPITIGNGILHSISVLDELGSFDVITVVVSSLVYEIQETYINEFLSKLPAYELMLMADGEENKNYRYAEMFLEKMLDIGMTRNSLVIGIGGGVVGDFAGFCASVYMRGIKVIHIPTTLLAMVDSSIGGKVAVNLSSGKNIIGTFHQPSMVISDTSFLTTLVDDEFKNGLTEVLKHGLIGDRATVRILENNDFETIRNDSILTELIYLSASFKAAIVEDDEKEKGKRAILNFGHTIGHAIESYMEYKDISHGEAVAMGIKVKAEISRRLGLLSNDEVLRIGSLLKKYNLFREDVSLEIEKVIEHIKYDKKNREGKTNFVLIKGIGNPLFNQQIDDNLLFTVMSEILV